MDRIFISDNIISITMTIVMIIFIIQAIRSASKLRKSERLMGSPIEKLRDGVVYHQISMPNDLIFLSEKGDQVPKAYVLDFDIKKLPESFMCLEEGKEVIPWDAIDLYDHLDPILDLDQKIDESDEPIDLVKKLPT